MAMLSRRLWLLWLALVALVGLLGVAGLVGLVGLTGCGGEPPAPPNIVFILTDDHLHDALGCAGHPFLRTPNLDRLAAEGVRFTNAFVTTSLCSPSRASFLTGCYAHRHGVIRNEDRDPAADLATFPEVLQQAGYETAFIGKWHLARWSTPRRGFDHWISFNGQGEYWRNTWNLNGEFQRIDGYVTDKLTSFAVQFLEEEREGPFMLWISHKAAHAPFTPARRHARLYAGRSVAVGSDRADGNADGNSDGNADGNAGHRADRLDLKPAWLAEQSVGLADEELRDYFRSLAAVDEGVGRILEVLAERGLLEETVIVYAGDNGFHRGEHGGLWDKRTAYEPSIRIPLLVRAPGRFAAGSTCAGMVLNIDLAPSLLELARVPVPASMQGSSWLDCPGERDGRQSFLYEYFQEQGVVPDLWAVRTPDWKYILNPDQAGVSEELYDLREDPDELLNLAGNPARASDLERMRAELARLKQETGVPDDQVLEQE